MILWATGITGGFQQGSDLPFIKVTPTQAEGSDAAGNGVDRPARRHAAGIKTAGSSVKNLGSGAHSLEFKSKIRHLLAI